MKIIIQPASNRDVTCQIFLFLIVIDWVMRRTFGHGENGIRWKVASELDNVDFADVALISSTKQQIQDKQQ